MWFVGDGRRDCIGAWNQGKKRGLGKGDSGKMHSKPIDRNTHCTFHAIYSPVKVSFGVSTREEDGYIRLDNMGRGSVSRCVDGNGSNPEFLPSMNCVHEKALGDLYTFAVLMIRVAISPLLATSKEFNFSMLASTTERSSDPK